jgi:hypothetical protein
MGLFDTKTQGDPPTPFMTPRAEGSYLGALEEQYRVNKQAEIDLKSYVDKQPQSGAIELDNNTMTAMMGVGAAMKMGQAFIPAVLDEVTMGGSSLAKGLTKNAYKLNPYRYKPADGSYFRGVGRAGADDLVNSGVLRTPKDSFYKDDVFVANDLSTVKNYSKDKPTYGGDPFDGKWSKLPPMDPKSYIVEIPKDKIGNVSKRGDLISSTITQIPAKDVKLLKEDLWKGYKEINTNKASSVDKFASEIDWANWNTEIPTNKKLLEEYHNIERTTKANGTWMKSSDGTTFSGTPEQFIQQRSKNFKKAFPDAVLDESGNPQTNYHGTEEKLIGDYFDESKFKAGAYGKGVYTSKDPSRAVEYSKGDTDDAGELYELYINSNNPDKFMADYEKVMDNNIDMIKSDKANRLISGDEFDIKFDKIMDDFSAFMDITDDARFSLKPGNDAFIAGNEIVTPFNNFLKSMKGNNGMFDMTNPNIYKSITGAVIGTGLYNQSKNSR